MDAYKWSNPVGVGRTDHKRPRLQRMQNQQSVHKPRFSAWRSVLFFFKLILCFKEFQVKCVGDKMQERPGLKGLCKRERR